MKTIIAGTRFITEQCLVDLAVELSGYHITQVVCGEAKGVDTLGRKWAEQRDVDVASFVPDWDRYYKAAGYKRNLEMGEYADQAVILWDAKSKGTGHMIDIMKRLNKPYFLFLVNWRHYGDRENA